MKISAAVVILTMVITSLFVFELSSDKEQTIMTPNDSIVTLHEGSRFTYSANEHDLDLSLEILPIISLQRQNGSPLHSIPFSLKITSDDIDNSEIGFLDLASGGLILHGSPCIHPKEVGCSSKISTLTWSRCPLNSIFSPGVNIVSDDLAEKIITFKNPHSGHQTDFALEKIDNILRIEKIASTGYANDCNAVDSMEINLSRALIVGFSKDDIDYHLVEYKKGAGNIIMGGVVDFHVTPAIRPIDNFDESYPPGTGAFGPPHWTLATAWSEAQANSEMLREFKDSSFKTLIADTSISSTDQSPLADQTDTWFFLVVRSDGEALEVESTQTCIQTLCQIEVTVTNGTPPEMAAQGFEFPESPIVDFGKFEDLIDEYNWTHAEKVTPAFMTRFSNGTAYFEYVLFRFMDSQQMNSTSNFISFDPHQGRLQTAHLIHEELKVLFF